MSENRIRELREAQGWSRNELASNLKANRRGHAVHEQTIGNWERGAGIPLARAAELADLFGVSLEFLLNRPKKGNGDHLVAA